LHLNGCWDIDINKFVNNINSQNVDIIIFNGDLFENYSINKDYSDFIFNNFRQLKSRYGCYIVFGNHESSVKHSTNLKKSSISVVKDFFKKYQLNRLKYVTMENKDKCLSLFGVPDFITQPTQFKNIVNNFHNINKAIIFSHNPKIEDFFDFSDNKNNLIVSGHTHAGQIYPFGYYKIIKENKKLFSTKRKFKKYDNDNLIFVSNGAGYSKKPIRTFVRNHIDIISIY